MKIKILFLSLLCVCSVCFGQTKCVIAEKRPDGSYLVTSFVNADGSPTYTKYKNAQEAALATPILSKNATGLNKDSDIVTVFLNDSGEVLSIQAIIKPVDKNDSGQKVESFTAQSKTDAVTLANDILTKEGKPILKPKEDEVVIE